MHPAGAVQAGPGGLYRRHLQGDLPGRAKADAGGAARRPGDGGGRHAGRGPVHLLGPGGHGGHPHRGQRGGVHPHGAPGGGAAAGAGAGGGAGGGGRRQAGRAGAGDGVGAVLHGADAPDDGGGAGGRLLRADEAPGEAPVPALGAAGGGPKRLCRAGRHGPAGGLRLVGQDAAVHHHGPGPGKGGVPGGVLLAGDQPAENDGPAAVRPVQGAAGQDQDPAVQRGGVEPVRPGGELRGHGVSLRRDPGGGILGGRHHRRRHGPRLPDHLRGLRAAAAGAGRAGHGRLRPGDGGEPGAENLRPTHRDGGGGAGAAHPPARNGQEQRSGPQEVQTGHAHDVLVQGVGAAGAGRGRGLSGVSVRDGGQRFGAALPHRQKQGGAAAPAGEAGL